MKVLFLCPSLVGAGVERRVCIFMRELETLGLDVRLGLLREEGEFLNEVPATRLISSRFVSRLRRYLIALLRWRDGVNCLLAIFQIRTMLKETKPDIVVSFTLETTIPMYFAARKEKRNLAWIISEDSNTAAATTIAIRPMFLVGFVSAVLGKLYRRACHISCVSKAVHDSVQQVYRVDRTRLSILPNPVEWMRIRKALAEPFNAPMDSDFIVSVGRLVAFKQFDLLIRAFIEVRKSRRIQLVILGEGPERETLMRLVAREGLSRDVLLPGFVNNPWSFMARAKMLVLSSKLEGFGNVIIESMAAGCPVIATRCGGPEDIIRDRYNGLLVEQNAAEIANAIKLLLDDPGLCAKLVQNASLDVPGYSPDKISIGFQALLKRVAIEQGLEI
ncbi:MAG: glycosyltransferase [Methylococcales bacterium]